MTDLIVLIFANDLSFGYLDKYIFILGNNWRIVSLKLCCVEIK